MALLYGVATVVLTNRFSAMEQAEGEENTQRVLEALTQEVVNLDTFTKDWAWWDDTYVFMEDRNETYRTSNLTASTFSILGLNWLALLDTEGKLVFGAQYDSGTGALSPFDGDRLRDFGLSPLPSQEEARLLAGAEGPFLVAAYPILTSEGEDPSRGILLFGRAVDQAFLERLSRVTLYPISFLPFDTLQTSANVPASEGLGFAYEAPLLTALDNEHLASDTTLLDLSGQPAVRMRIMMPRPILSEARSALLALLLLLLALGVFFGLLTSWILDRFFLRRLDRLSAEVKRIGKGEGDPDALLVGGNDEITLLAQTVRETLTDLERSREEYRTIFETTGAATLILERESTISQVNEQFERFFSYSREEVQGKPWTDLIQPEDQIPLEESYRRYNQDPQAAPVQYEVRLHDRQGSPRELLMAVARVPGTERIVVSLLDITVTKRAQEALQESERRYREVVENLAEGVAILDQADLFLYLNPAGERIFGLPAGRLLGHSLKEFIDPAEHEAVDQQAARRRKGERGQYENTIIRPDRSRRRLLISSVAQNDDQGQVGAGLKPALTTLSIFLDITEQRQVEDAIQKARTDLLFAVSHEMKTPLMSLAASREILETLTPAERERKTPEYEAMWAQNLARLRRLIDNLVDSQRTQTTGMQLKCQPSNLNDLVRGVLAETASLSARQELRFELFLTELPPILLDREAISRLVENLVINAVKFSPRRGLITLGAKLEGDHACLTISDQGPGIATEEITSLFQPFQRSPEAVRSGVQGTGLGLYVSKMIAEAHGGSVELESQPGQGTTVRVRLPLHAPE
ncbi:MAG: PAS domain S-box protein [Coprothermobacterota bacterium]|nr:PAS domain S-box protein [Coprothermobacterota bacterium]